MIRLNIGDDTQAALTALRSIAASLESLVELKRRELLAQGIQISADNQPEIEVFDTDEERDYLREQRAKVLGRMGDLDSPEDIEDVDDYVDKLKLRVPIDSLVGPDSPYGN